MKASALEFRFRFALHTAVYVLGLTAPWNYVLHLDPRGPNAHTWGILAANLAQLGVANLFTAFNLLLSAGILLAAAGAALRTWGSAYLGAEVVQSAAMHTAGDPPGDVPSASKADGILKDGPFAHLRNPLYLGTFLHTLALALLMPRSGAIFAVVAIGILQVRLILGEEAFLSRKLGAAYLAYCALVPRLWPRIRARVAAGAAKPRWMQAFLAEIYFWGVAASFAIAGWRYNANLLIRCAVVSAGLSIVTRAFVGKPRS